ncbi:MAG: hypothetical protein HC841_06205 [Verrucomicrobiae bacterium]|nr:hypothetical protein [Verrucomicrobiae bacterium]
MSTVTLAEAESSLGELVRRLATEGEILITDGQKPVATLTAPQTGGHSLLEFKPRSVGEVLRPVPHPDDDLLGEMLAGKLSPDK